MQRFSIRIKVLKNILISIFKDDNLLVYHSVHQQKKIFKRDFNKQLVKLLKSNCSAHFLSPNPSVFELVSFHNLTCPKTNHLHWLLTPFFHTKTRHKRLQCSLQEEAIYIFIATLLTYIQFECDTAARWRCRTLGLHCYRLGHCGGLHVGQACVCLWLQWTADH